MLTERCRKSRRYQAPPRAGSEALISTKGLKTHAYIRYDTYDDDGDEAHNDEK